VATMTTRGNMKQDREIEKEIIREHLRQMMGDMELDPKVRLQAMQLLGKDAGMWKESDATGTVSLQVLIADMRAQTKALPPPVIDAPSGYEEP